MIDPMRPPVWRRHPENPILPAVPGSWMESQTANPDLLRVGDRCHLYFRGQRGGHDRIGLASVPIDEFDGATWHVHPNPIIDVGGPGDPDEVHALDPATVLVDGKVYLYYSAVSPSCSRSICLATSQDGIHFEKHPANPVVIGGGPEIVYRDSTFHLFYWKPFRDGFQLYLATSPDGVTFREVAGDGRNGAVLPVGAGGSWDSRTVETPRIFLDGDTYVMMYCGSADYADYPAAAGLAWSTDLVHWRKHENNPIFHRGEEGEWDEGAIWFTTVERIGETYYLWYEGYGGGTARSQEYGSYLTGGRSQIGLATAPVSPEAGRTAPGELASRGGKPAVRHHSEKLFHWPIVTRADERAVREVLRAGTMSGIDITREFEREFGEWLGAEHTLATCNGTAALLAAFWACGVGAGDEIICPSMTYWASALPALTLGATVHFADIDRETLCIDPRDIEHRISPRTRAIVVVHYAGYPAAMDEILAIARRHDLRVIEDVSHAHGARYRGCMLGTIGDIAAMSMMAGKGFPVGEGGMIATSDRELFERCVAFGHYERTGVESRWSTALNQITDGELNRFAGAPIGGVKHRMNQMCSALGRTQLRSYDARIAEIQDAMNHFWDRLEGLPGLHPHRVDPASDSTMGGWYYPQGLYRADELGGLSAADFCAAVRAEGVASCSPGGNDPLHLHPVFHEADLFHMGRPTSIAFGQRDVRQERGTLPNSERIRETAVAVPWFKRVRRREIDAFARAFRKVVEYADDVPRGAAP